MPGIVQVVVVLVVMMLLVVRGVVLVVFVARQGGLVQLVEHVLGQVGRPLVVPLLSQGPSPPVRHLKGEGECTDEELLTKPVRFGHKTKNEIEEILHHEV